MVNFSSVLKDLRKQAGMSQNQLAEQIGVTKSVVSYYELSARIPSPDVLLKIADVFHVTTDYLLGREPEPKMTIDTSELSQEDVKLLENVAAALRNKNKKPDSGE